MREFFKNLNNEKITDKYIRENEKYFNVVFDAIKNDEIDEFRTQFEISDDVLLKVIDKIKKSKSYFWYFSLDPIRNGLIKPIELIKILKEEVLYNTVMEDKNNEIGRYLCNMYYNFIVMRLNPDSFPKTCKDIFNFSDEIIEVLHEFYKSNYSSIQMNFIITRLSSK